MPSETKLLAELNSVKARRERFFAKLQAIFDLIPFLNVDAKLRLFKASCASLENISTNFEVTQNRILEINPLIDEDARIGDVLASTSAFDEMFYTVQAKLQEINEVHAPPPETHQPTREYSKLPTVNIPVFNGEYENFSAFRSLFDTLIHNHPTLTSIEKFSYLKSLLTGTALAAIQGYLFTPEYYLIAYQTLVNRFTNKRVIANHLCNKLWNIKPFTKDSQLQQFLDVFHTSVEALKNVGIVNLGDFLLLYMALGVVDSETRRQFEQSRDNQVNIPSYKDFINFVQSRVSISELLDTASPSAKTTKPKISHSFLLQEAPLVNSRVESRCVCCNGDRHTLYRCNKFQSLSPRDRYDVIKQHQLCINCLSFQHLINNCPSTVSCSKCGKKHHSLLHFNNDAQTSNSKPGMALRRSRSGPVNRSFNSKFSNFSAGSKINGSAPAIPSRSTSSAQQIATNTQPSSGVQPSGPHHPNQEARNVLCSTTHVNRVNSMSTVLLSTVKVNVMDASGNSHIGRFLLDCGSQSNFVTVGFCTQVGLDIKHHSTLISGLGFSTRPVIGKTEFVMQSTYDQKCEYIVDALVVHKITEKLPSISVCMDRFSHVKNLNLADDQFGEPAEIHGLIGAALFPNLLLPGQCRSASTEAVALNTTLGYVIVGEAQACSNPSPSPGLFCGFLESQSLESMVQQFWLNEELPQTNFLSKDDQDAEDHFQRNHFFDPVEKRYCVRLPFKEEVGKLGQSYQITYRRFLALEKKLERSPDLKQHYKAGIEELIADNHLVRVEDSPDGYFVPHHLVTKTASLTTKHRIVFDFSCPTHNGVSLNDLLHCGATLYNNLFEILLQFRLFKVAIVADVRKMFLQILLHPEDHQYQKLFWRPSPDQPVQTYSLTRVMFGAKCSPFLAQRVIRQLAVDKAEEYPLVKPLVEDCFYMDDLTASLPSEALALEVQGQLIDCFESANFELLKWASNRPELLKKLPETSRVSSLTDWNPEDSLKILGMNWNDTADEFLFRVNLNPEGVSCTKRIVLSNLAKIWDPLGLISPVTVYCKFLLQSLWGLQLDWDQPAPADVSSLWCRILEELGLLSNIKIPRHVSVFENSKLILVGYCDASERACAAVIYTRVESSSGTYTVKLLCSKSKVAPLKKLSIPRLELNASLLLAKLISLVHKQYSARFPIEEIICFSDSTIALHWIGASPHRWQTYVANRVSKIQELVPKTCWYHVTTDNNPSADCLSRGLLPSQLIEHSVWFDGPPYLQREKATWPISSIGVPATGLPEEKSLTLVTVVKPPNLLLEIVQKYSSWKKLLNILVYIYRFLKLLPKREQIEISDLDFVEKQLWLSVQREHFSRDLKPYSKLTPFIDEDGIIRVGGRLENSNLPYNHKHPILLPKNEPIVRLLIRHLHERNLHTGPALLLSLLRQNYWILAARPLVRKIVQACNFCFKFRPQNTTPIMGDLPKFRVEEVKVFASTGLDFAGPYKITLAKNRGNKSQKSYLCLFICLATKALHLELVSDLSREAFLNALKRFLARRGPVATLYSDNGTNFIGAKNHLNELYQLLASQDFRDGIGQELLNHRITWKMIPASAPHMGGIWERAIQSCKIHIQRVVGEQVLTFEELSTVFAQVEALLNSRPLCVLSSDPNELEALTPAHFLNLTPLQHLPAAPVVDLPTNRVSRYQLLDKLVQSFWKRWHLEYLHQLQEKSKWSKNSSSITKGTIVLIKHDSIPPLQWPLGIVVELFPSHTDNVVRVVNVKTRTGIFKRPVIKLCPLPTQ